MQYTHLGRTGLEVSRLCLGTMNFGPRTEEKDSHAIMDASLAAGINFFDTANMYGGAEHKGWTEEIIGRWFALGGGRREKVVLATKVYARTGEGRNDGRLSAYHIRQACEDSLSRLQTDHIDLYQMHHVDRNTPWQEIWQAMELLVQQGKVIYVGSSNFAGIHIVEAMYEARLRNFLGLVSEQSFYNLAKREIELEVVPACEKFGLGILPWSPLYGGVLGGMLEKTGDGRRATEGVKQRMEEKRGSVEAYEAFCKQLRQDPADVALAWLLTRPAVTAPIIGPRTMEQLNSNLRSLDITLTEDQLKELDTIWPGPGGPAPEAYAW